MQTIRIQLHKDPETADWFEAQHFSFYDRIIEAIKRNVERSDYENRN